MRIRTYIGLACAVILLAMSVHTGRAEPPAKPLRAGIIGLDTTHAVEFTKALKAAEPSDDLAGVTIVAAYPGGSADIPASRDRIKGFTDQVRGMGVEIVDSIDELLKRVDVVFLESVDGRTHLAQARPVIAAGKPLFIDKPMAASLADAIEIFRLAKEKGVPCFSASSLRFSKGFQAARNGTAPFGEVRGCTAWSPMTLEPHHPDLFWYGIHGVETLFTIMGPGCQTVTRAAPDKVVGVWKDGRQGTFVENTKHQFGATVEGSKQSGDAGKWEGYRPMLVEIVKFFKTGKPPVDAEETLEILAFMEAADQSKRQGGAPVSIESVMEKAKRGAGKDADPAAGSSEASRPSVRRSDVVFMSNNPSLYEAYGCTVTAWGGGRRPDAVQQAHEKGVRLVSQTIGFLTEMKQVIDFSPDFMDGACRNFAGEPFVVPWLWDHQHKGQKAWWWCTNSPTYQKYLQSRLESAVATGANLLHIDDYAGTHHSVTWLAGCFCPHCMAGFREYLTKNLSEEKRKELDIADLSTFDYRQYLLAKGVTPADYTKRRPSLPLAAEFYDFQVKAATQFVVDFHNRAEQMHGGPMSLAVNSGAHSPASLAIAPYIDFFCCEVPQDAEKRAVPLGPIYIYKLTDGLGKPVTPTAKGQDWAYIKEHNLPGLVRTWIALSYVFGDNFMAPHRQWCYTTEKGTHWYAGRTEDYAWLYQFVRKNARLLDDYDAAATVAVVYDNAADRRTGKNAVEPICLALAERNVPFAVVVAGDDWLPYQLDAAKLKQYQAVVVAEPLAMDEKQRAVLDEIDREGRLVRWPDDKRLAELAPPAVQVEGATGVLAVVRHQPGNPKAPLAVHLISRRYDDKTDSMQPQRNLTLRLRTDWLGGRNFTKAVLHAPKADSTTLDVSSDGQFTTVKVPELNLWAIVELAD